MQRDAALSTLHREPSFASQYYFNLSPLCLSGLRRTLNLQTSLYDQQLRDACIDATWGSEDFTSTCICLIGIDRTGIEPNAVRLNVRQSLAAATEVARRNGYLNAIGLLIWANAVVDGPDFSALAAQLELRCDEQFMANLTTMELAWLLSGLLHEVKRSRSPGVTKIAEAAGQALRKRISVATSLARHAESGAPWRDRIRTNIPNFADQIYTLQALSFASIILDDAAALAQAALLAARLVALQGSLGQWWWHYDVERGDVAEPFPVYSVHQHAMAPMAFYALRAAGGPDHADAVKAGQEWIFRNEVARSLVDAEAETIWRDVERDEPVLRGVVRKARHLLVKDGRSAAADAPKRLRVNQETRPYEWAWCLYAGAVESSLVPPRHVV